MTDQDIYSLFSEQFRLIDDNLDDLVKKAKNFVEATQITDAWKQANLNYLKARNKIFSTHGDEIKELVEEFSEAQESIKESLEALRGDSNLIGKVSKIISLAVEKGKELQESV